MPVEGLIGLLLTIIIVCLIFGLLLYLVRFIPDAAMQNFARIAIYVIAVIALIIFLVSLLPAGGGYFRHL